MIAVDAAQRMKQARSIADAEFLEQFRAVHFNRPVRNIEVERNLALVALVGNKLTSTPGIADRVFSMIREYNIRLMCHGASERNLCFLVNENKVNEIAISRFNLRTTWSRNIIIISEIHQVSERVIRVSGVCGLGISISTCVAP